MRLRIVRDSQEAINAVYDQKVRFTSLFTEAKFDKEWTRVRDRLYTTLCGKWSEGIHGESDFAISDDRSTSWTQCGGIYTRNAMCRGFARTVAEVLSLTQHPKEWGFHCVIELWMTDPTVRVGSNGGFVVKDGILYIPNDDAFDYTSLLK